MRLSKHGEDRRKSVHACQDRYGGSDYLFFRGDHVVPVRLDTYSTVQANAWDFEIVKNIDLNEVLECRAKATS